MSEEPSTLERWSNRIGNFLIGSMVVAVPITVWYEDWFLLFITVITLLLFLLTKWLSQSLYYKLPITFEVAILIFIFLTMFVGDGLKVYWTYPWWDLLTHTLAGVALGFLGFLMLYMITLRDKISIPPLYVALFSLSFSVLLGVGWEFFEYFMDTVFGTTMTKGAGYEDIVWDLISDFVGALIASIFGYLYLKGKEVFVFNEAVDQFVEVNEHVLKRKRKS